jgi:hypothetical protein
MSGVRTALEYLVLDCVKRLGNWAVLALEGNRYALGEYVRKSSDTPCSVFIGGNSELVIPRIVIGDSIHVLQAGYKKDQKGVQLADRRFVRH